MPLQLRTEYPKLDKRRMCPNCRAFITSDDKICPYCQAQVGERVMDRRSPSDVMGGLIPHDRFVTMLILLINTGLYVATMLRTQQQGGSGFGDPSMQTLLDFGAKSASRILYGGEWTTPSYLSAHAAYANNRSTLSFNSLEACLLPTTAARRVTSSCARCERFSAK